MITITRRGDLGLPPLTCTCIILRTMATLLVIFNNTYKTSKMNRNIFVYFQI